MGVRHAVALLALVATPAFAQVGAEDADLDLDAEDLFFQEEISRGVELVPLYSFSRPDDASPSIGLHASFPIPLSDQTRLGVDTFFVRDLACGVADFILLGFGCNREGSLNSFYLESSLTESGSVIEPFVSFGIGRGIPIDRDRNKGNIIGWQGGAGVTLRPAPGQDITVIWRDTDLRTFNEEVQVKYEIRPTGAQGILLIYRISGDTESVGLGFKIY